MRSQWLTRIAAILGLSLFPAVVRAQGVRTAYDKVTVAGSFGGLSGAAHLDPAGATDWRLGWSTGADGTVWLHQYVGLRASGRFAQDSLRGATVTGRGRFNKFTYDGDLVLRYPTRAGSG